MGNEGKTMELLEIMEDELLVERYKQGEQDAFNMLLQRYTDTICLLAKRYYPSKGLSYQDYYQEGAIGLFQAVKQYKPEKQVPFHSYAKMLIRSQLINAIKMANRKKHVVLNDSLSLYSATSNEENGLSIIDLIHDAGPSPEEIFLKRLEFEESKEKLDDVLNRILTLLERKVLLTLCAGLSYTEAAQNMGINTKSVDNALCRVKSKLEKLHDVSIGGTFFNVGSNILGLDRRSQLIKANCSENKITS